MSVPIYDPVYGGGAYTEVLIDPDVYGDPFAVTDAGFTADAVIKREITGSFTADAKITPPAVTITGSFTADAWLRRTQTASFTGDAIKLRTISGTFTANAVLRKTASSSRTADAVIRRTTAGSFTADMVVGPYFRANAIKKKTITKVFTADALLQAFSFTASAYIVVPAPGEPGGPPVGTKIPAVIKVNGVDITDDVIIRGATFTQAVNARPGQFQFEVKDDDHIYHFVSGGRVTLDIDNRRAFDGYLDRATLRYAFPVDITSAPDETPRIWRLEGPDLNILFTKRMIFDQVNPNADLPTYAAGTQDITIIRDFMRHYIDLRGDDITYDGITHVGSPNPDADGYIIPIGSPWGAAMAAIGQLPGAVWGLTQDRDLFYEDDSTESAPFRLSDTPNNSTTYGYRDFSWTDDGTRLVNDAQVWGAGTGSTTTVYSETTDATSIAAHGRWQIPGQFRSDMFRQATVDNAADSIVYGSPQNLHGGKDPYILVECTIKKHGLRAGNKVRFINSVYGLDKVLPIRRLTITFVNLYDPLYRLELTQEIDEPWFFAEFAGYTFPPFRPFPKPPRYKPPRWHIGDPACDCGITDSFTRTETGGWGVSDTGFAWTRRFNDPANTFYVDGSVAVGTVTVAGGGEDMRMPSVGMPYSLDQAISGTVDFHIDTVDTSSGSVFALEFLGGSYNFINTISSNASFGKLSVTGYLGHTSSLTKTDWVANTWYRMRFLYDDPNDIQAIKVWPRDTTEPVSWDLSRSTSTDTLNSPADRYAIIVLAHAPSTDNTFMVDNLDIDGLNSCANFVFDDFSRTISSGNRWGSTTPKPDWGWINPGGTGTLSVNGTQGLWTCTTSASNQHGICYVEAMSDAPWIVGAGGIIRMRTAFQISVVGTSSTNFGSFEWKIGDNSTQVFGSVEIRNPGGLFYVETATDQDTVFNNTWTANADYNVILEYEPGVAVRMKVWLASTAEPGSWTVQCTDIGGALPGADPPSYFQVEHFGRTSKVLRTQYISFDGDNPCEECHTSVIDDFSNRSIPLALPPSQLPGNFWGSTSGEGIVWRNSGRGTVSPTVGVHWGVVGGVAQVQIDQSAGSSIDCAASLNTGGSDVGPFFLVGNGFPSNLVTEPVIDFRFDIMADSTEGFAECFIADNINTDIGGAEISIDWDSTTGGIGINTFDALGAGGGPIPAINTWYTVRIRFAGGAAGLKVWETGTTEPGWQYTSTETSPPWTPGELTFLFHASAGSGVQNYWLDNIVNSSLCDEGTATTPGPITGAYGCENATRVSATEYSTSLPFVAGTTEVSLNGRMMRPFYDYIESTLNSIEFTLPVDVADTVYVCYHTIGLVVG